MKSFIYSATVLFCTFRIGESGRVFRTKNHLRNRVLILAGNQKENNKVENADGYFTLQITRNLGRFLLQRIREKKHGFNSDVSNLIIVI